MDKQGIAQAILRLRTESRLSQTEFGEKLGYSQKTVSDWETGRTKPCIETVKKIVKMFEISYEDLLD